jgi:hypothetical protein
MSSVLEHLASALGVEHSPHRAFIQAPLCRFRGTFTGRVRPRNMNKGPFRAPPGMLDDALRLR